MNITPSSARRIILCRIGTGRAGSHNGEGDCGNCRSGHGIFLLDEAVGCNLSRLSISVFDNEVLGPLEGMLHVDSGRLRT